MSTYLVINLLIVLVPVLFSFEKKIRFYKKIPSYLISVFIISPVFILWDSLATSRGDWGFNPEHILTLSIYILPLEEVLFFITVPYSCLFIYETICFYIKPGEFNVSSKVSGIASFLLAVLAIVFIEQYYTATVLFFASSFIAICILFFPGLIKSKLYWITIAITFIPFLIFNFVLTYIPVVIYSNEAIWGLKLITIPLEDFFYSYSMISFWILVYSLREKKINTRFIFSNQQGQSL